MTRVFLSMRRFAIVLSYAALSALHLGVNVTKPREAPIRRQALIQRREAALASRVAIMFGKRRFLRQVAMIVEHWQGVLIQCYPHSESRGR